LQCSKNETFNYLTNITYLVGECLISTFVGFCCNTLAGGVRDDSGLGFCCNTLTGGARDGPDFGLDDDFVA
jgi:hypothetical protein